MRAFLLFLCLLLATPTYAQSLDDAYVSAARNAILIDSKSGQIFYEKDADAAVPPASMSKLMTHAIIFDMLKSGELTEDQLFTVSNNAWKKGGASSKGSTMYAKAKEQISIRDLLRGSIIASGNDATIALAEGVDKRESAFITRLNARAEALGLKNSSFGNVSGLPDPKQRMSVRDIATLARYIITEHPKYFPLYSEREITWNKVKQPNRNPLLADYPGADGMKTGFTKEAGYGLVGTVERGGRRLIMVIAGLPSIEDRKAEAEKLLDWGLGRFRNVQVYGVGDRVGEARVWGGSQDWVDLITRDSFSVALTDQERSTAEVKLSYQGPLIAPVTAGTQVGIVRVMVEGKIVAELPVLTSTSIETVPSMWKRAWDSTKIMVFGG
jgi:serine-type D-Ala-D-Ala carboxypeptidase (penicillin-binding protein 5/6)